MIVKVTPRHRRPFRAGGIEFPAEGRELDLSTLSPAAHAAITGEYWLVITTVEPAPVVSDPVPEPAPAEPAAEPAPATARSRRRAAPEVGAQMKKTDLI
jgi:hypothetical protein